MTHRKTVAETKFNHNVTIISIDEDIGQGHKVISQDKKVIDHLMSKSYFASTENSTDGKSVITSRSVMNSSYPIMDALKPIFWILKIFGFYYTTLGSTKAVNSNNGGNCQTLILNNCQSSNKCIKSAIFSPLRIYAMAVCLLLWFNAGRLLSSLPIYYNTAWMPFTILCTIWAFQVAGNATLLFHMCHRKIPTFIKHVNMKQDNENPEFLTCIAQYMRRRCVIYLIPSTICVIMNSLILIFFQFGPFSELKTTMSVIVSPFQNTTVFPYFYLFIIHVSCSAAWIYPVTFCCLCCLMVTQKFHILSKHFKEAITSNHDLSTIISIYRKRHETYCVTTQLLSDAFSLFIAQIYATNLAITCFNLYRMLFNWASNGLLMNIALMVWLVIITGLTILISSVASNLNQEVSNYHILIINI